MIINDNYKCLDVSKQKWRITFEGTHSFEGGRQVSATLQIEMHELEALKYEVSATRINGSALAFHKIYDDLY